MLRPENVQHYPRPPRVEPVEDRLRVELDGVVIAETVAGMRVLETHHAPTYYFPLADVMEGVLSPAAARTICEWKGAAQYFDVAVAGRMVAEGAWSYARPAPAFRAIAGHVAFYAGRMDGCYVGSVRASPQPGGFYGGWVTPNLSGIVKGRPGSEGW